MQWVLGVGLLGVVLGVGAGPTETDGGLIGLLMADI